MYAKLIFQALQPPLRYTSLEKYLCLLHLLCISLPPSRFQPEDTQAMGIHGRLSTAYASRENLVTPHERDKQQAPYISER